MIPKKYEFEIRINPKKEFIKVEGIVHLINNDCEKKTFFDLHNSFEIENLFINDEQTHVLYSEKLKHRLLNPAARRHYIEIPDKREIKMRIYYSGKLVCIPEFDEESKELFLDDRINEQRIELASYSTWYPQFSEFGKSFIYDIVLNIPSDFKTVSQGKLIMERTFNNKVIKRWQCENASDIVILGSKNFKVIEKKTETVNYEAYFEDLPEDFIRKDFMQTSQIYAYFEEKIGKPIDEKISFKKVFSPKKFGQGAYQRGEMTVFSQGYILGLLKNNSDLPFLKHNAHELAHMWWHFSKGKHDWINEAFAEFFSLLAVKNVNHYDFKKLVEKDKKALKTVDERAHCLYEYPLSNLGDGTKIRYIKGALLLNEIYEHVKEERFFELCREFYNLSRSTDTTSHDFEEFWTNRVPDLKNIIGIWLHSPGSAPL
ncbi:MAG: aminopeptidase [Kosmotogales bacterium]|nr:aminopeptidase [Kosmotogales bacterium]